MTMKVLIIAEEQMDDDGIHCMDNFGVHHNCGYAWNCYTVFAFKTNDRNILWTCILSINPHSTIIHCFQAFYCGEYNISIYNSVVSTMFLHIIVW